MFYLSPVTENIFCKPHTKPVARRSKFTRVPCLYPALEAVAVKVLAIKSAFSFISSLNNLYKNLDFKPF